MITIEPLEEFIFVYEGNVCVGQIDTLNGVNSIANDVADILKILVATDVVQR